MYHVIDKLYRCPTQLPLCKWKLYINGQKIILYEEPWNIEWILIKHLLPFALKKQMENANKRMSECTQLEHLRRCPGNSKDGRNFVTAKFVTKWGKFKLKQGHDRTSWASTFRSHVLIQSWWHYGSLPLLILYICRGNLCCAISRLSSMAIPK